MMEFLPLALEFGMSVDMFWHYDEDYFKAYHKAYFNRISRENWINGKYVLDALYEFSTTIMPVLCYNGFSGFKPKDIEPIPYRNKPIDFFEGSRKEKEKKILTEEEIEQNYRDRLNYWL